MTSAPVRQKIFVKNEIRYLSIYFKNGKLVIMSQYVAVINMVAMSALTM